MSHIDLNPGTGGASVATDVYAGDHYQRTKMAGDRTGFAPGYSGSTDPAPANALIDEGGNLVTRSTVLTDEGTFRCNFANSSLWVGIGSVTVSGTLVTGTGFLSADVHLNDYFKVAADADSLAVQIASIDSDTELTLKSAYTGSTNGTGNRSIMLPYTGTGGSWAVASGQLTITAGTTAASQTGVKRFVDYGPLVYRARGTISQRIANQSLRAGLREDVATPRWFAWFLLDGTTNTTLKCQTARNPTGAPSAAETQETTITLPGGATTATARDYRVELLTESVRFYIDGVLMAEHTVTIPHQHDEMAAVYEFVNGTTPASGTTAVVDYVTGKNHNKLEIGVMSDAEKIVASQPPLASYSYNQAGVIAINTNLITIDCSQVRAISVQCVSMGTSGVVTFEVSNNGANWQSQSMTYSGGTTLATINGANLVWCNIAANYFRLRLSTATTAGTTTFSVCTLQNTIMAPIMAITGSVTANIGSGALSAGTNAIGDVGIQVRANATGAQSVSKVASAASTNATNVKASAGRVLGYHFTNTTAAVKVVRFYNLAVAPTVGTSVPVWNVVIPANGYVSESFAAGRGFATGIAYAITGAIADLDTTAVAANDVIGAIDFA